DELADLVLGDAIGEGAVEMALELLRPVHRGQRGDGDQAAVALREAGPLPHVAEQDLLRQIDELRDDSANGLARRVGGLRCGHDASRWVVCLRVGFSHGEGGRTMPTPAYRIFAVRYAHRKTTTSDVFYRDTHDAPIGMDYFVWALVSDRHTVVVDLGFTEPVGTRRGRTFLRCPSVGLAEIGVDCQKVEH